MRRHVGCRRWSQLDKAPARPAGLDVRVWTERTSSSCSNRNRQEYSASLEDHTRQVSTCFLVFGDLISSSRSPLGHAVDDPQRQTVQAPWCTTSPHAGQCFHYFPGPQLVSGRVHLSEFE